MAEKLKPGWKRVKFGDVVRQVKDKVDPATSGLERYIAGEHMDTDDLRLRRWGTIGDDYLGPAFHMRFKPGQVLYGSRRTYLRKVAVADFEGICANTTFVLEPKDPQALLPEYLPFLMQTEAFHEHSKRESKGSVNPYVNFSDLAWWEFALPPLKEQRGITRMLSAQQALREACTETVSAAHGTLRSFAKAIFIQAPEGKQVTVGDVAEVRTGSTPSRKRAHYWSGSIPWLPTGKVNNRRITSADEFVTERALAETSLSMIPAGSTLVAMIGEGHTRGRAARMELDACINQNFAAVTPGAQVEPLFLFFQLEAQYASLRRWSQGTNQQALNASLVRAFPFWLPSRNRQLEVCEVLTTNERAWERATRRAEEARAIFRQAIASTVEAV